MCRWASWSHSSTRQSRTRANPPPPFRLMTNSIVTILEYFDKSGCGGGRGGGSTAAAYGFFCHPEKQLSPNINKAISYILLLLGLNIDDGGSDRSCVCVCLPKLPAATNDRVYPRVSFPSPRPICHRLNASNRFMYMLGT